MATSDKFNPTSVNELYIPPIVGRLLIRIGMPVGGKCIQNWGLPEFIREGEPHILRAYLEEVIPEDGSFSLKTMRFSISRSAVLLQPSIESEISYEELELILKYGTRRYLTFGYPDGKYEVVQLQTKKLEELALSSTQETAIHSTQLLFNIFKNRCNLIYGEKAVCGRLGIKTRVESGTLTYFVDTGRLSSSWELYTCSIKDAMKWAIEAPPNDIFKYGRVQEFIQSRPDLYPDE